MGYFMLGLYGLFLFFVSELVIRAITKNNIVSLLGAIAFVWYMLSGSPSEEEVKIQEATIEQVYGDIKSKELEIEGGRLVKNGKFIETDRMTTEMLEKLRAEESTRLSDLRQNDASEEDINKSEALVGMYKSILLERKEQELIEAESAESRRKLEDEKVQKIIKEEGVSKEQAQRQVEESRTAWWKLVGIFVVAFFFVLSIIHFAPVAIIVAGLLTYGFYEINKTEEPPAPLLIDEVEKNEAKVTLKNGKLYQTSRKTPSVHGGDIRP